MKLCAFYHKDTGLIHSHMLMTTDDQLSDRAVALNTPPDHIAIDGHHDFMSKRVDVDTGQVVDYQPPQPSEHHEWNATTRRWQIGPQYQAKLDAHNDAVRKIASLESVQNRFLREVHLGINVEKATARLQAIETEIVALRKAIIPELLTS